MTNSPTVYVCHSSQDDSYALRFVQDLLNRGVAVWTTDATARGDVTPHVADIIRACGWFVVVHTPDAVDALTVQSEIAVARAALHEKGAPTLVAFVATTDAAHVPPDMRYLDAAGAGYPHALQQLLNWMELPLNAKPAPEAAIFSPVPGFPQRVSPALPHQFDAAHPVGAPGKVTVSPRGISSGMFSRRQVMAGALTLLGAAALGTGGVLLARSLSDHSPQQPLSSPHPSFLPQGRLLLTYSGHSNTVNMVAWSFGGRQIASASADATAQVWDASTGTRIATYSGHSASVSSVAWAHGGDRIATSSNDSTVQIWDATTGNRIRTYAGHTGKMSAARWSPDDARIASGGDDGAQIWDANSGTLIFAFRSHTPASDVAWSPDGRFIAVSSFDKTVTILDTTTQSPTLTYAGHTDPVFVLAWSPDGRTLASAGENSGVHLWNPTTGDDITNFAGNANGVNALAWSHDSRYMASGGGNGQGIGDTRVLVWDATTKQIVCIYTGHPRYVNSVDWSPDNQRIVSGSDDHTVQVWQVEQANS